MCSSLNDTVQYKEYEVKCSFTPFFKKGNDVHDLEKRQKKALLGWKKFPLIFTAIYLYGSEQ